MQTCEETLSSRQRIVPRLGLAARADPAAPWARRSIRVGLPDSAQAGRRRRSTDRPAPTRTSPTCTPGPRCTCPVRAGSASTPPRACSPARATFRSHALRTRAAPRRSPAWRTRANVEFSFAMHIERIVETPRVTYPYTEDEWSAIDALGRAVDEQLAEGDVRLTMGGEPTFVAIDDVDAPEWNTAAHGPHKRALAATLIGRLRDRFAPGGLLHFGQGKWYPGESLPRWAFALYWRGDAQPLWRDARLIAQERDKGDATLEDAKRFTETLAALLGVDPELPVPAFEDPVPYLTREQRLPENVDPFDSKLEDPEERARLARVFERGLAAPVGYVLPLQRWNAPHQRAWYSERWTTRRGRLFLVPGDSPIGFRLPLESLPHVPKETYPYFMPADPFAPRAPMPGPEPRDDDQLAVQHRAAAGADPQRVMEQGGPAGAEWRSAHRARGRAAGRPPVRVPAADRNGQRLCRTDRLRGGRGGPYRAAGARRGLHAARRRATQRHQGHAGPGRHRGQRASRARLAGARLDHLDAVRGSAAQPPGRAEVHGRRPPHRHRRWQPRRRRRRDTGGQPLPAPARPAAQPDHVLAESSVALVPVLGTLHRSDQPGAAHRRRTPRPAARARNRVPADGAGEPPRDRSRRGSSTGCCATS